MEARPEKSLQGTGKQSSVCISTAPRVHADWDSQTPLEASVICRLPVIRRHCPGTLLHASQVSMGVQRTPHGSFARRGGPPA